MSDKYVITCPVRGQIKVGKKSKGKLSPNEEFYRVEAIKHLVSLGYSPKNILLEPIVKKFGSSGRNSFRSDFAVLDVDTTKIDKSDPDLLLEHALILGEVKKDNSKSDYVKNTQVKPMLDFSSLETCIGIYWDNVEQRVYWQKTDAGKRTTYEGALQFLPHCGQNITTKPFAYSDLAPVDSLIEMFDRVEDILHQASFDHSQRYEIILQLILAKIFDEHSFAGRQDKPVEVQDFSSLGVSASTALVKMNKLLSRSVTFYEKHLPNKVSKQFPITGEVLVDITKIISPILITRSKRDVVQTFYMKFAKHLYKWDLAQYFTPTQITDFIIDVLNPQFGEHVYDPACGSADFLVGAFHKLRQYNAGYADCIWGSDNSSNAVQVAVLNMLLNGDGKTNIHKVDSLETVNDRLDRYDIVVCNPPFGTKIVEKRKAILRQFDLGHEWALTDGIWKQKEDSLLEAQETGLLFAELCIKQAKKEKGRIALIVPNGYLGNRSPKYRVFREWILRHSRIAGIVGFPRFTFKSSGADVSASVIFLERREKALDVIDALESYPIFIQLIENVGWEAGNKRASVIYKRDEMDGSLIFGDDGELIIDSDFSSSLEKISSSLSSNEFEWIEPSTETSGWSIDSSQVLSDVDLTLDPKRYCEKYTNLKDNYRASEHIKLGDLVEFISERADLEGNILKLDVTEEYKYVELQRIGQGDYDYETMRGWQLPSRAKHFAVSGDIYFASIWSSVDKWCYIGDECENVIVTNGCIRCRIKLGKEDWLVDLISFMCTEGWTSQLRALARGSDGLAEINTADLKDVIIPRITSDSARKSIMGFELGLKKGRTTLKNTIKDMIKNNEIDINYPSKRGSHMYLV
ncbi:N-6 DNA methylase [Pseudoalteromonas haloplanktis]|uniref:N-6 DNA methylase n=1 Tax=Pseudoalteromonas haloplanktis TaxID=228 RepID=A0ABU1BD45_PSEHA|nr:N-6 DNA methylase [Pseudoalteromonas haloplanktis]MDQ9092421.1 N-6 DNA methylase [Pseudoalteromonas haloplanktis]